MVAAGPCTLPAGGMDHYSARADHVTLKDITDISALPDLRSIASHTDHWHIPCGNTWTDLPRADLPPPSDARHIPRRQAQNAGAIVGEDGEREHASAILHPNLGAPAAAQLKWVWPSSPAPKNAAALALRSTSRLATKTPPLCAPISNR